MLIPRLLSATVLSHLEVGKALILIGPRQVGKTTLSKQLTATSQGKVLWLDCDEPDVRKRLVDISSSDLRAWIGDHPLVVIDEAQRVKNIGLTLKLLTDKISEVKLIVTGSSSLEIANQINEPLTGRKWEFMLLPISTEELCQYHGSMEEQRMLSHRMIYGMYPELIQRPGKEEALLRQLSSSYLYKDIFSFYDIRKPEVLEKMLQALALQLGSELNFHELAKLVGTDQSTVQRYLDLLEKAFVVFRLPALSRNLRNELKKSRKVYFYDNGIRNAIINNFKPLDLRVDKGALWENFLLSERMKWLNNHQHYVNQFFWRTTQQQEIDYIEERDGQLLAYEFKWNTYARAKFPITFLKAYPNSTTQLITPENYLTFVGS